MFEITRLKMIDIIHQCMDEQIRPGDTVCDCTMGNGHDTAYMCRLTGDTGTVYSFDIQPEALSRTEALLAEEHLLTPARLILDSHSHLKQYIDHPIRFFVFNLGYLPDGDPTVITKATSTLEAIEAALSITETGGGGAVLSYYGHPGGAEEKAAVEEFLHNLPPKYFSVMKIDSFNRKNTPPVLYLIKKLKDNRKI